MVEYFRPATLGQALALRAERPLVVLAGGTDVYPARATRAAWGDTAHGDVLDITALDGLRAIERRDDGWHIGCLVTWSDVVAADLPAAFDGLKLAAREIGGVQIQNRATLVGNICNASPAADGVPCLLALDAEVELASAEATRRVPLGEFLDGYRHTVCGADELVTGLVVPALAEGARSHFLKLGARHYLVISIAMVAGVIVPGADGTVADARIAVGACSVTARRLAALERELCGQPLGGGLAALVRDEHAAPLAPIDDVRASGEYRRAAALDLVRDLLATLGRGGPGRAG